MKVKFDIDINEKELIDGLKAEVNTALSLTIAEAAQHGRNLANSRFKGSGKSKWLEGFKTHKVNNDLYVISIEGKIPNWMEDGIRTGEISEAIKQGNRAFHNKSEGKDYVDVPMFKDADATGNIRGTKDPVSIRAFADADQMLQHLQPKKVKISDYKNRTIKEERRITSRVQDIIKSVDPDRNKSVQYLTIRRLGKNSVWPKTPYPGAKILEDLGQYIDQNFENILKRVVK